ncbi:MAG: hypothetical protein LBL39_02250 [Planctomycetaceae bacterium]|jgi:hypothetical protein|nr:hypothetical protein [Planctomycetaceae bacterium]
MSLNSIATAFSSYETLRDLYASRNSNGAASGVTAGSPPNETDEANTSAVASKTKYFSDDVVEISDKGKAIPESSGVYSSRPSGVTEPSKSDKDESIKSDKSDSLNSAEMKNARVGGGGQLSKPSAPPPEESESESESEEVEESSGSSISVSKELTAEEEEEVQELKELDAKVRQNKADKSGGDYIQNDADYIFQTGPDGNRYAIAEAVSVDVSQTVNDSETTTEETQQTAATLTAPTEQPELEPESEVAVAKGSVEAKAEAENANAQNGKYGIFRNENTILKSFAASAYSNQSTLSNSRASINRINVFA